MKQALIPISNERGVGILQMLVLVAVSTILIGGVATSITNMYRSQSTVSQSLEANLFNDQLTQVLSDDAMCSAHMTPFLANLTGAEQAIAFHLPMSMGDVYVNSGTAVSDNLAIDGVTTRINLAVAPQSILSGGLPFKHYQSVLSVKLKKLNSSSFVQSIKPFEIPMHLMVNPLGQATGCAAVSAGSMACLAQGGTWNPLAADGQKCIALQYCQYGGSWAEAADSDGGFINALTGGRSCPSGFASQQSGTISKVQSTGKYSVANSSTRIFTCMRCGSALAAQTAAVPPVNPVAMASFNQDAYDAVAATDKNNYDLAASDTLIAYRAWQDGITRSNQLQAQITQSTQSQATATQNVQTAQNGYNSSTTAYNQASADYNSALAAYNASQSSANAQAVANAQNAMNARSNDRANAQSSITYWQQQKTQATSDISNYTSQKQTNDTNNQSLYAIYIQKKAISDNLQQISAASTAAANAHQEPAY